MAMHVGANVEVAHQFPVSLKQGGLLLLQKCQFCLAWEVFFVRERPKWQSRDFPHLIKVMPSSPIGVKKVPEAGQYNLKMALKFATLI